MPMMNIHIRCSKVVSSSVVVGSRFVLVM